MIPAITSGATPGGATFTQTTTTSEDLLIRLGVFLGNEVLGTEIKEVVSQGVHRRTLLVRVPESDDDHLAAAFARVPWETARLSETEKALMDRAVTAATPAEDEETPPS